MSDHATQSLAVGEPSVADATCDYEALAAGGHAYTDCRVYNTPAIRSVTKAGFVGIATMRPISRRDALPSDS